MFLLDTDAISELEKPQPNAGLIAWYASMEWNCLHLSVISVAEIWHGIIRIAPGKKRRLLEVMFDSLPDRFRKRILSVDYSVAVTFAEIQAKHGPLPVADGLIAATALNHRLTLVTHNVRDMARTGVAILDPWSAS